MFVLFYISLPLFSKKQAAAGETQVTTFPRTMYTCAQLATAKNTNLIWKRDASALHRYSQAGARCQIKIWNFTFSFQYKPANAGRPVYLIIFLII